MFRTIIHIVLLVVLSSSLSFGDELEDKAIATFIRTYINAEQNVKEDVWAMSKHGGYIWKSYTDLDQDGVNELLLNSSLHPDMWQIMKMGKRGFSLYGKPFLRYHTGMVVETDDKGNHYLKKSNYYRYANAYWIDEYALLDGTTSYKKIEVTKDGENWEGWRLLDDFRKIHMGVSDDLAKRLSITKETAPDNVAWMNPEIEGVLLADWLSGIGAWAKFNDGEAVKPDGVYCLKQDLERIEELRNKFTAKRAKKLLDAQAKRLGLTYSSKQRIEPKSVKARAENIESVKLTSEPDNESNGVLKYAIIIIVITILGCWMASKKGKFR